MLRAGADRSGRTRSEGLSVIERNTRVQVQLIDDLLDMGRIMSGKMRLDVQRVELADVIEAALETGATGGRGEGRSGSRRCSIRRRARLRRPGAAAAGLLEPAVQRDEVHAQGRVRAAS